MKRFHVHVALDNLADSIRFYSTVFGVAPTVVKPDYAKWMLEDPRINFAISRRGHATGVNHLGLQVDSDGELKEMRARLEAADSTLVEQTGAACCYARSDKYWVTDPAGIAWETFHSLGDVPVFGEDSRTNTAAGACCTPVKTSSEPQREQACCVSNREAGTEPSSCCA